jgi:hypothetical protein
MKASLHGGLPLKKLTVECRVTAARFAPVWPLHFNSSAALQKHIMLNASTLTGDKPHHTSRMTAQVLCKIEEKDQYFLPARRNGAAEVMENTG